MRTLLFLFNLSFVLFFGPTHFSLAQGSSTLTFLQAENSEIIRTVNVKAKDTLQIQRMITEQLEGFSAKGHPLVSIDRISGNFKAGYQAYLYLGPKIKIIQISVEDAESKAVIKSTSGLNERFLSGLNFSASEIGQLRMKILNHLGNSGYPFAQVSFQNILISETPRATLVIEKGPLVKWKKIHIKGDLKLSEKYLLTYLEIREGDLYSEEKFQKAAQKINQLSFASSAQSPQIAFYEDGVDLYLYLTKRNASSANGILGLQPNNLGKTVFTGEIQLALKNATGAGEIFDLSWRNLLPESPQLNTGLALPFLFNTRFGAEGKFHLYKRDTSFLEVKGNLGIRFFLGNNSFLRGFYNFEQSNLLAGSAGNPLFSDGLSVRINGYGLGLERQVLDYLPNPRQGFSVAAEGVFGSRSTASADPNDPEGQRKSNILKSGIRAEYFIPFGKRSTVKLGGIAHFYFADTIYTNEQFRFGGFQTLRGFDEESFLGTSFSRITLEYRFLLDRNSHLLAFIDQAWYENRTRSYVNDTPIGFGAGLSFGTKAGMFSVIYALGRQFDNNINIRDGKIHIGYLAVF